MTLWCWRLKMMGFFLLFSSIFWNSLKPTKLYCAFNHFFTQEKRIQTTKSNHFISYNIFSSHLHTCMFATMISNHNSSWIKCHMVTNHLWTTSLITKQLYFHLSLDTTGCWMIWLHFSSSFLSKLIVVASHSHICNLKPFCNHNTSCFYVVLRGQSYWNLTSTKNGWFGHKLQTHGLVWTWFLVAMLPKYDKTAKFLYFLLFNL
jgi:hypothetical protein